MKTFPYGVYSKELREEAAKLVIEGGVTIPEAGRRLSIPESTVRKWVRQWREGTLAEVGKDRAPLSEAEKELAKVRMELAEVKMERDLLKKAAAYFAKESQRGTRS